MLFAKYILKCILSRQKRAAYYEMSTFLIFLSYPPPKIVYSVYKSYCCLRFEGTQ